MTIQTNRSRRWHDFLFRIFGIEDPILPYCPACDIMCGICNEILPKKTNIYTLEYEPHDEPHLVLYACKYCYDKIHRPDSDLT